MNERIEKASRGDRRARADLVDALQPRIASMAAHYGRITGEDPDDLQQEAWFGLLEALPHIDMTIGDPRQHLILRARWRLLDAVKRARLRRCLPLDAVPMELILGPAMEGAQADIVVREFAGGLKETQRLVLTHLMTGLTWREVGERLGCTSANVAYHVREIRARYEAYAAGEPARTGRGRRLASAGAQSTQV